MDPESTDGEAAAAVPLPQALRAKISEMIYVSKGPGAEQRKLEAQLRACETYAQLPQEAAEAHEHARSDGGPGGTLHPPRNTDSVPGEQRPS